MSEQQNELDRLAADADASPVDDRLVTIATFPDPSLANLARAALDSAGIPSFMHGENANNMIPVAFMARLQVRGEDEAAAREILETPSDFGDVDAAEALTERPNS